MSSGVALLLGIDTPIGLSIIRELGEYGVSVIGLGWRKTSLGQYSRFLAHGYVREREEGALIAQIKQLCGEHAVDAVMAISESDMQLLNRHRHEIDPVPLLVPEPEVLARALDKASTYRHATAVGIDVPTSWTVADPAELEEALFGDDIAFPVVLKWPDPLAVVKQLGQYELPLIKAEYAYTRSELLAKLARYKPLGLFPTIQGFCPGQGLGQFFLIRQGKVIQRFQHLRVHEWPPEGGFSTLCSAVPLDQHAALREKSEQLLLNMGWEGVAMVEYRYSPDTGKAWLMEVNGRFWGSLPLAYHCGAQFAWLLFEAFGLGRTPAVGPPRDDLQCRYMIPETRRLLRVLGQPGRISDRSFKPQPLTDLLAYCTGFFNPRMRYFVFSWKDPLPFFADLWGVVLKALKIRS